MWDCHSDNNALLYPYSVVLVGVVDLQLNNLVWWWSCWEYPSAMAGLGEALEAKHSSLSVHECMEMKWIKAMAKQLFLPSCGGNYKVWDVQPLTQELMDYCCDTHTHSLLYADSTAKLRLGPPQCLWLLWCGG
jgi:exonuclease 3'-5' domain-containing protein 1